MSKLTFVREEKRDPIYTNPGCEKKMTYKRVNDPNGSWHLEEVKVIDTQEMIQSAAPPSIQMVLKHAARGDFSLLEANSGGVYADVSEIGDLGQVYLANQKAQAELTKVAKNKKAAADKKAASEKVITEKGEDANA